MSGEDHASRSGGGAGSEARGGGSPGPHRAPTSSSSSTSNPFDPATLFGKLCDFLDKTSGVFDWTTRTIKSGAQNAKCIPIHRN